MLNNFNKILKYFIIINLGVLIVEILILVTLFFNL